MSKIFINYRRGDDPGFTQALFQLLEGEFKRSELFMDIEGYIQPGDDFVQVLTRQVAELTCLLDGSRASLGGTAQRARWRSQRLRYNRNQGCARPE